MSDLTYTLLAEGSSDRALIPILNWILRRLTVDRAIQALWADLWRLPERPRTLAEKIEKSVELYPCDLLFVHRDGDNETLQVRVEEIRRSVERARAHRVVLPVVCVVPIRTQEAWLLFDEMAIRRAVGNPNGSQELQIPRLNRIESLPRPKETLYDLLRTASEFGPRRLRDFRPSTFAPRVSEHIDDFSRLRDLRAFTALEADLAAVVHDQGWDS
jgi:Domain of unknown function (DUF4276)